MKTLLEIREFQSLLRDELTAVGLIPGDCSNSAYQLLRTEVSRRGKIEHANLVRLVGRRSWNRGVACLGRVAAEEDCVRVLGFGSTLAEFAMAPLGLTGPGLGPAAALGALANLIVSLYDQWLDSGVRPGSVLPRWHLRGIADGRVWLRHGSLAAALVSPRRIFMARLVDQYFHRLGTLPYASARPAAHHLLIRTIQRMYDAESATISETSTQCRARMLRRKSALPFVVLGLPGWLAVNVRPSISLRSHLGWLYRLGEFIGCIDDAIDLAEDASAGRPNLLLGELAAAGECRSSRIAVAQRIAARGSWVLREWRRAVPSEVPLPEITGAVLGICVGSWFGASAQAPSRSG
jgi:hypothetical protein